MSSTMMLLAWMLSSGTKASRRKLGRRRPRSSWGSRGSMCSGEKLRCSSSLSRLISFSFCIAKGSRGIFPSGAFCLCYTGYWLEVGCWAARVFSTEKRRGGILCAVGPAARTTHSELLRPMPPGYRPRPGWPPVMGPFTAVLRCGLRWANGSRGPVPDKGRGLALYPTARCPRCCTKKMAAAAGQRAAPPRRGGAARGL